MAKIKPLHLCLFCGFLVLALICVVVYTGEKIDDSHPSFVKEFLDNPETEISEKDDNEMIKLKLATIESVNAGLGAKISNNSAKITNLITDVATNSTNLEELKNTVEQASSELSDAADAPAETE